MIHSKPENFTNEDSYNPVMAPQIGPQPITQDFPFNIGEVQSLMVLDPLDGPLDPLELWHMSPVWPWGTLINPTAHIPHTIGDAKDPKGS
ncbi:hypothetical protein O181_020046 [Austropuccinia psidii MF-1]|uniref:Uncharacterized protein n=1 Tax=Austropuccinia psidii MF-1 TaxID=1389203 RepID=A0A9Q3C8C8_9BASI|nr:hypothetical protein [Austropuccinia psidii MF-1]